MSHKCMSHKWINHMLAVQSDVLHSSITKKELFHIINVFKMIATYLLIIGWCHKSNRNTFFRNSIELLDIVFNYKSSIIFHSKGGGLQVSGHTDQHLSAYSPSPLSRDKSKLSQIIHQANKTQNPKPNSPLSSEHRTPAVKRNGKAHPVLPTPPIRLQ